MCGRMWVLEGVRVWMRVCGCMCVCVIACVGTSIGACVGVYMCDFVWRV